jgi:hypothetical protein
VLAWHNTGIFLRALDVKHPSPAGGVPQAHTIRWRRNTYAAAAHDLCWEGTLRSCGIGSGGENPIYLHVRTLHRAKGGLKALSDFW